MKHIKAYSVFESQERNKLTEEQEKFLKTFVKGTWEFDPSTGLVDVDGDVAFAGKSLGDFRGLKFGKVSGSFYCSMNRLTSLMGSPREVGGNFICWGNELKSLAGAPEKVSGSFHCYKNELTSLAGAPLEIGEEFQCDEFFLYKEWNPEGWLKILEEGPDKARELVLSLLTPEELNKRIAKDPAGMIENLKTFWNKPWFKETRSKLIWPNGYEKEMDLAGDLDNIGF
jgi:hypothetical protein